MTLAFDNGNVVTVDVLGDLVSVNVRLLGDDEVDDDVIDDNEVSCVSVLSRLDRLASSQ